MVETEAELTATESEPAIITTRATEVTEMEISTARPCIEAQPANGVSIGEASGFAVLAAAVAVLGVTVVSLIIAAIIKNAKDKSVGA